MSLRQFDLLIFDWDGRTGNQASAGAWRSPPVRGRPLGAPEHT